MTERKYVFIDADQTLLNMKSLIEFEKAYLISMISNAQGCIKSLLQRKAFIDEEISLLPRAQANRMYYAGFHGRKRKEVLKQIDEWAIALFNSSRPIYMQQCLSMLFQLTEMNYDPVVVSGSFTDVLRPFVSNLGINYYLTTTPEVVDGIYTGNLIGESVIGPGKAKAVKQFLIEKNADPKYCIAMGDHVSDANMLEMVGTGIIMPGDKLLEKKAKEKKWKIL